MAFMKRFAFLLLFISAAVAMSSISSLATAPCSTCGATEEDWTTSAANFLEGKPVDDTIPIWGPKAARLTNSKMDAKPDTEDGKNAVDGSSIKKGVVPAALVPEIMLKEIRATPNPAAPNSTVTIAAVFAGDSSQSPESGNSSGNQSLEDLLPGIDQDAISVFATIKDPSGTEAGNVTLKHTSGNEYSGVWNASSTPGIYQANLTVSASGAMSTFDESLQIEVAMIANTVHTDSSGS